MASLLKKRDNRFWIACFRDSAGRQCRRTTRETNRKRAQAIANQYASIAQGKVTQRGAREIMAELYRKQFCVEVPTPTVESYIASWLKLKAPEVAPVTLSQYRYTFSKLLEFLGDTAKADIVSVTRRHIVEFRNWLSESTASCSVNAKLQTVKLLFHCAKRDGYIVEDPTEFAECLRVTEKGKREAFTISEVQALLSAADTEWRSMILFGLYTGQRIGDICRLTWDHIDLERDEIRLVTQKTGTRLIIPIAPTLRAHLESMPSSDTPGAPLHPSALCRYSNPKTATTVAYGFAKLLVKIGLREPKCAKDNREGGPRKRRETYRLSFHSLRHTAVSMLKDAGVPQATVLEFIGHASADISAHYTHVGMESLKKAAASFPSL